MLKNIDTGAHFLYADRQLHKPVKCTIVEYKFGYPPAVLATREDTNDIFLCYDGFGVYDIAEYDKALKDAKKQQERRIL